jgi:hypothetical protein
MVDEHGVRGHQHTLGPAWLGQHYGQGRNRQRDVY